MLMQYSFDLRRKLMEAWQSWDGTQEELAELLGVSRSWVQKVLRRFAHSGDPAAPLHRHGPLSRVSEKRLAALVAVHPDATVAELGRRLRVSASSVCRALQRMDLPRKKRACMRASAIRLGSGNCVRVGGRRVVIWTRST
jgi:transposase